MRNVKSEAWKKKLKFKYTWDDKCCQTDHIIAIVFP